jgi:hypothetical protein
LSTQTVSDRRGGHPAGNTNATVDVVTARAFRLVNFRGEPALLTGVWVGVVVLRGGRGTADLFDRDVFAFGWPT